MRKDFALILILIIAISSLSLMMVKPVLAQTPTPSVPEFTVRFVVSSYEVRGTQSINPYTGQNETTRSYFVDNSSIQLIIANQPSNGNTLYYNIQMKGHFEENWTDIYQGRIYPIQSNSNSTLIEFTQNDSEFQIGTQIIYLPEGSKVDFRVEAEVGYFTLVPYGLPGHALPMGETEVFTSEASSGWSSPLTVTLPASTIPEFPSTLLLIAFLLIATLGTVVIKRKQSTGRLHVAE